MMTEQKITGRNLLEQGWQPGPIMGIALEVAETLSQDNLSQAEILTRLNGVRQAPVNYENDPLYSTLAKQMMRFEKMAEAAASPTGQPNAQEIRESPVPYRVWGDEFEEQTMQQLQNAARLPIARRAALMPDGHPGYGLPIGGVVATENSVIPFGVGMDIACRMRLSIFNETPDILNAQRDRFRKALIFNTRFGLGGRDGEWQKDKRRYHEIIDDPRWHELPILRQEYEKAVVQLGTSGTSNHFAEWASLIVLADLPSLGLEVGQTRLCFVTHSGSRGVGATIAEKYTRVAKSVHPELPKQYQELAWLDLDSEAGQEYWLAMHVAGDFASACHQTIHETVIKAAGLDVAAFVENHHNFAWREVHGGQEYIVHRKGATPAGKDVLGVIPGTMADKGYLVVGLGNQESLCSSAHGAGRPRSRTATKQMLTRHQRDAVLKQRGVELLNPDAGVDEAPQAYKNPELVMGQQADLVRPIASFMPMMVMMASEEKFGKGKRR